MKILLIKLTAAGSYIQMLLIRVFEGERVKETIGGAVSFIEEHHAEFFAAFVVKSTTGNTDDTDRTDFHGYSYLCVST